MAKRTIILTLAIFAVCHGSDPFENVLGDSTTCNRNCSEIYKAAGLTDKCERGCRFHVIEEFVTDDHRNDSVLKITCHGSCVESYGEISLNTDACNNGCDIQQKIVDEQKKKEEDEGATIHLLSPLMQVHAVYSSFVGAVHVVRSSLITYFVSDDNSIIAVESEPQIVLGIDPEAVARENPILQAQQEPRQLTASDDSDDEPSVVKCVSRQIGVPPYILVASVVALVVFTLYVIIAFCSTTSPSKAKAYATEKSMQVDPMPVPVKLVRPEDLTRLSFAEDDDMQAPALPLKVKLPDSLI